MNTHSRRESETEMRKPWLGAPEVDAIWRRHTESPPLNEEHELSHLLAEYAEMASKACELERQRNASRADYETQLSQTKRLRGALEAAASHLEMLDRGGMDWAELSTAHAAKIARAALAPQ